MTCQDGFLSFVQQDGIALMSAILMTAQIGSSITLGWLQLSTGIQAADSRCFCTASLMSLDAITCLQAEFEAGYKTMLKVCTL